MLGAYVCFMATTVNNMPYWLSCVLGIGGAAVISFLNEKIAYRKIRNNGSPNMFLMIAAMGLSTTYPVSYTHLDVYKRQELYRSSVHLLTAGKCSRCKISGNPSGNYHTQSVYRRRTVRSGYQTKHHPSFHRY